MSDVSVAVRYHDGNAPTVEPWEIRLLTGDTVTWESDPEIESLKIRGKQHGQLEKYFAIPNNGQKKPKTTQRKPKPDHPGKTETVPYEVTVKFVKTLGRPPEVIDPDMVMD